MRKTANELRKLVVEELIAQERGKINLKCFESHFVNKDIVDSKLEKIVKCTRVPIPLGIV